MGHFRPLFSLFLSFQYTVDSKKMFNNFLPMTGFEPRTSGIGSDRSTNWATQPLPIDNLPTFNFIIWSHWSHSQKDVKWSKNLRIVMTFLLKRMKKWCRWKSHHKIRFLAFLLSSMLWPFPFDTQWTDLVSKLPTSISKQNIGKREKRLKRERKVSTTAFALWERVLESHKGIT